MEVLEVLSLSSTPLPVTEILKKVGIKHITGKKILQSMLRTDWISESLSNSKDDRFGNVFALTKRGRNILGIYQEQIRVIFHQLGKK
jgi:predicted transcriptional regulator